MRSLVEVRLRKCGEKLIRNPFLLDSREEGTSTRLMSTTIKTCVIVNPPYTIIQVTCSPLTDEISRFLCLKECLVGVNIRNVQ